MFLVFVFVLIRGGEGQIARPVGHWVAPQRALVKPVEPGIQAHQEIPLQERWRSSNRRPAILVTGGVTKVFLPFVVVWVVQSQEAIEVGEASGLTGNDLPLSHGRVQVFFVLWVLRYEKKDKILSHIITEPKHGAYIGTLGLMEWK